MKIINVEDRFFIYAMIFSLSNRIQKIGDESLKDLTIKQHFLMVAISVFDKSPTLKEISDLIGCSYQNVKTMASTLEKKGFLNIIRDEKDKRKLLLVLTNKSSEFSIEKEKETLEFMQDLYKGIDKESLKITLRTLIQMDNNIGGSIE